MARNPLAADLQDTIVDAALGLAAEKPWEAVRMAEIAERAGMSLAELRGVFAGRMDVLAAFATRIDRTVLDGLDPDLAGEPARDRIFDVMMARLDALAPHREAVRSIVRAFEHRPPERLAWNRHLCRSMGWMLEAAGIDPTGGGGAIRVQGLAMVYGRTLRIWLADDDPGLARTMVALDRSLRDGESCLRRLDSLCSLVSGASRILRAPRRSRRYPGRAETDTPGPEASPG